MSRDVQPAVLNAGAADGARGEWLIGAWDVVAAEDDDDDAQPPAVCEGSGGGMFEDPTVAQPDFLKPD